MDFVQQVKSIFGFSPQKDQQNKYKARAKSNGLMSIAEFSSLLISKDEEKLSEILSFNQINLSIPCSASLATSQVNSVEKTLKLKDQVIFDNSNFHGIIFDSEELTNTVKKLEGQSVTLNVNHSQNPEHFIGYFSNAKLNKDNQITADIEIDTQNPAFFAQKYAIEKGVELGFSIEVAFDWDWEFIIKPTNAEIFGCATTMIPSAPATLTEVETDDLSINSNMDKTLLPTQKLDETAVETTETPVTESTPAVEPTELETNIKITDLTAEHLAELATYKSLSDEKDEQIAKLTIALEKQIENLSKANTALEKSNSTVTSLNAEIVKLRKPQSINNFL